MTIQANQGFGVNIFGAAATGGGGGTTGAVVYQGTWNASTNTPTLTSSVGSKGDYYVVSVAGSTNLNGITDWQIGDWAIFNGTVWQKVDNTEAGLIVNTTATTGGAAGQIMFDTGSVLQESSNLVWDNTNKKLTITGATVTTSQPVLDMTQTWDASGTTFTGLKFNATNTASAAASLLMDLQVGGVSQLSISKAGVITVPGNGGIIGSGNIYIGGTSANVFFGVPSGGNSVFNIQSGAINAFSARSTSTIGWTSSSTSANGTPDTALTRRGAANLRLGAADAAAPVAQTLSVQSVVAGTSNTAGANLTITGSQGTGTGAGGDIIFQTADVGASGTAQNTLVTALRIYSNQTVAVGKAYTVATLPAAGTQGRRAWVTDATAPTFLGALIGGGAVVCPVFDNGTAWVAG